MKRGLRRILKRLRYAYHPLSWRVDPRVDPEWVISRVFMSKGSKYCYFRIPKCANSTVVRSLAYYDPHLAFDETDQSGARMKKAYSGLSHSDARRIGDLSERLFCFTFVRNPYSRLLSAYLDRIVNSVARNTYNDLNSNTIALIRGRQISFDAFVGYLESGGLFDDPHWCPQTYMIPIPINRLSFVGKVENIDEHLSMLNDILFGKQAFQGTKSRQVGRQGAQQRLAEYYTPQLKKRVYDLLEIDFESFSYPGELEG